MRNSDRIMGIAAMLFTGVGPTSLAEMAQPARRRIAVDPTRALIAVDGRGRRRFLHADPDLVPAHQRDIVQAAVNKRARKALRLPA